MVVICKFSKNPYFISPVLTAIYGKVKNCVTVSMTYLPLPDHTAYSIRANLIIVEILIIAKIQTGHRAPQFGKTLEFEQAFGMRTLRRATWL